MHEKILPLFSTPPPKVCVHGHVRGEPRDAAEAGARNARVVNSQRLFTSERSKADASAPSEGQALHTREHIPPKATIVVAMSGGVDSSVTAALLKKAGYDVIGLFMKNWEEEDQDGVCTITEDYTDVIRVADRLQIPHYACNFSKEYKSLVFDHFLAELQKGRTPNPDILCNQKIKFKRLLEVAKQLGGSFLATGHYAQIEQKDSTFALMKAADATKDQTYFLYTICQDALSHTLFPIGGLKKKEVRAMAKEFGLATAQKKDSTGICFIGERNFSSFLSQYLPYSPGNFELVDGTAVGKHKGIAYYTIGQRKGLGLGGEGEAWFVVGKNVERNAVIVARGHLHPALFADTLIAKNPHWVAGALPFKPPFFCSAKIRYRQPDQPCVVEEIQDSGQILTVRFMQPQRAITEEQSIVFYLKNCCLGGAIIEKRGPSYFEQQKRLPDIVSDSAT